MRFCITLTLLLFLSLHTIAQERTITGTLTAAEDGEPMAGVNIVIKGTTKGTVTDIDGWYSIKVEVGQTLVFSFIGMSTREVLVTKNNLKTVYSGNNSPAVTSSKFKRANRRKRRKLAKLSSDLPQFLYTDSASEASEGIAVLTDKSFTYHKADKINVSTIKSIQTKENGFAIKSIRDQYSGALINLELSSSVGFDKVNKLPELQNQYAQGRPLNGVLQWQGADQSEFFSWGPLIRTLAFDGSSYPYDQNGRLVPLSNGNTPAKQYDATSLFKTGHLISNELIIGLRGPNRSTISFDIENRHKTGVIPNSDYRRTNLSANLKNLGLYKNARLGASLLYNKSTGNLLHRGGNLAGIVGGIFRTPATFDNFNGLNTKDFDQETAFRLSNENVRNHSPGLADNPVGLINDLPDKDTQERFLASLKFNTEILNNFAFATSGNIEQQKSIKTFGIPDQYTGFTNGLLTHREETKNLLSTIVVPSYHNYHHNGELNVKLFYEFQREDRQLNRIDGFGFDDNFGLIDNADSTAVIDRNLSRNTHRLSLEAKYRYKYWAQLAFTNRSYFSNTLDRDRYTNFFPTISLSIELQDLFRYSSINELKIYGSRSRSLRENTLIFSNWSYNSTGTDISNYASFYESSELIDNGLLDPEIEQKFETGVNLAFYNFSFDAAYFNNVTENFIVPASVGQQFELQNIGSVQNEGVTISAKYRNYDLDDIVWGISLNWYKRYSEVRDVSQQIDLIPLAGFEEVQSVFTEGQPVGAIYGSSYLRNDSGDKVIGDDGFPIKNNNLKMIGSPIPDWTLGWESFIKWKSLRLSFIFDFKKGGDIWNGTNSVLDYLGRSANTANLRSTSNFVFTGVDTENNPNTIAVDFADPNRPLAENRWVRYGWDGIAEEYIEDASWVRLQELSLSYSHEFKENRFNLYQLNFSLTGYNLLLFTPYTGVDPSANLFGDSNGTGLDLFNTPGTRSYNATVTLKL